MLMWYLLGLIILVVAIFKVVTIRNRKILLHKVKTFEPNSKSNWRGKNFLLILNPYGGQQLGKSILEEIVKPMFSKASINIKYKLETQHRGHAVEFLDSFDSYDEIDGIVVIGGDGMLSEVLNGLIKMTFRKNDPVDEAHRFRLVRELFEKVPLLLIPGGSSNGLVMSLFGTVDVYSVVARFINTSSSKPIDINRVQYLDYKSSPSHHEPIKFEGWDCINTSFGMMADHDVWQEDKLRWMETSIRNLLSPLLVIVIGKEYKGKLYLDPVELYDNQSSTNVESQKIYTDYRNLDVVQDPPFISPSQVSPLSKPRKWRLIDDSFRMVVCVNVQYMAYDAKSAPHVKVDEGAFDIVCIRTKKSEKVPKTTTSPNAAATNRWQLLNIFLGVETGAHIVHPHVEYYKVRNLIIEPQIVNREQGDSWYTFSGELKPTAPLLMSSQQGLGRFIY